MDLATLFEGFDKMVRGSKEANAFLYNRIKTSEEFFAAVALLPNRFKNAAFAKRFNPQFADKVMYELSKIITIDDLQMDTKRDNSLSEMEDKEDVSIPVASDLIVSSEIETDANTEPAANTGPETVVSTEPDREKKNTRKR